jgi:photosystem II stability/assembly factor-like uncharacterized protein
LRTAAANDGKGMKTVQPMGCLRVRTAAWTTAVFLFLSLTGCAVGPSSVTSSQGAFLHLNDLSCPASGGFVAVGHRFSLNHLQGVVFHSSDRGLTWHQAVIAGDSRGVSFGLIDLSSGPTDSTLWVTGYASGDTLWSQMLQQYSIGAGPWWTSEDGGANWQETPARVPIPVSSGFGQRPPRVIRLADGQTLVAVAQGRDGLMVLRSTDGGRAWRSSMLGNARYLHSIVALPSGILVVSASSELEFLGGQKTWVFRSSDAGVSWESAPTSIPLRLHVGSTGQVVGFNFHGLKYGRAIAYRMTDGALAMTEVQTLDATGPVVSTASDRKGRILALTEYGYVLRSDNGGESWTSQRALKPQRTMGLRPGLHFFENGVVLGVVGPGSLLRSTDRGDSWSTVETPLRANEGIAQLCADGQGLVVAMGGWTVIRSLDWGATWERGSIGD